MKHERLDLIYNFENSLIMTFKITLKGLYEHYFSLLEVKNEKLLIKIC